MQSGSEGAVSNILDGITVLYEDGDVLVISKPAGLVVHHDGRTSESTVVDWFLSRVPEARGVGEPGHAPDGAELNRSGVVHRLDRDTSGVLMLAKTQEAFSVLKQQFHNHVVKKEYRTFVYGAMKNREGTITRRIGRNTKDFRLRSAEYGARGTLREAVTDWKVIAQSARHAYLSVFPKTGRTHQIRVHLKSIGRPIIGDVLYAPASLLLGEDLGLSRLALHAYALTTTLPSGEEKTFIAPLPHEFEEAEHALATEG